MPDHRSHRDPFYGWNAPRPISLCVRTLKECQTLPFEAIRKMILSKRQWSFKDNRIYIKLIVFIWSLSEWKSTVEWNCGIAIRNTRQIFEKICRSFRTAHDHFQWFCSCTSFSSETTGCISQIRSKIFTLTLIIIFMILFFSLEFQRRLTWFEVCLDHLINSLIDFSYLDLPMLSSMSFIILSLAISQNSDLWFSDEKE